jgi:hypothetical protein
VWRSLGPHLLILTVKLFYQEDAWKRLVLDHGANDVPPSSLSPEGGRGLIKLATFKWKAIIL